MKIYEELRKQQDQLLHDINIVKDLIKRYDNETIKVFKNTLDYEYNKIEKELHKNIIDCENEEILTEMLNYEINTLIKNIIGDLNDK